jgi:NitT/TauT family transport system ATP-binding protein
LEPQGGRIEVSGLPPKKAVQERMIGLVPQANTLLPNRTVRGNVALPLMLRRGVFSWRALPKADKEQVGWALKSAQIDHAVALYPPQLSAGMAARTMLARAIVHHPSLLLIDEGLANLDEVICEGLYLSIQHIFASTEMSAIIVSHRITEVVRLAARVLVLRRDDADGPSRIVHEESVPLGWPRKASVLQDPVFLRACANVRANLGIGGNS